MAEMYQKHKCIQALLYILYQQTIKTLVDTLPEEEIPF